jgi:hypothetical protein
VSVVLQVLGATYSRLRAKLTSKIGEQKVGRLEKTFDFLKTIVTGGLAAAWQKISEFAGNLQEMVIGGIKEWVMRSVITAAITKLISMFNPAGAIVQAVMAIYNTVMFFIERGSQIAALAQAVFSSIGKIAAGNVAGAAKYVEETMGRSLPVIISFLARLIGLGGVSDQIKNVIKKIQDRIDNALNKLANFIVQKGANRADRSSNPQPVKPNTVGRNNQKPAPNNRQNPQPVKPNTVGRNNQRPVPNNPSERQQQQQAKLDHDRKVKKGLAQIDAEEKQYLKNGRIWKLDAQKVAAKVKRDNPVFKSITVVDGSKTWDYDWVASRGKHPGEPKAEKRTPEEELKLAKERFGNKVFPSGELRKFLMGFPMGESTAERRMTHWKDKGQLFKLDGTHKLTFDGNSELVTISTLDAAKDFFKNRPLFSPSELRDFLMKIRMMDRNVANETRTEWEDQRVLFPYQSRAGRGDTGKSLSFDENSIPSDPRPVRPGNREVYGYDNPDHASPEGKKILAKGLIVEKDPTSPTGYKYDYEPGKENDWNYLNTDARFRCVARSTTDPLKRSQVALGHKPRRGAAEHWNGKISGEKPGHTQMKHENKKWNQNPENYHGTEKRDYSSSTGSGTENFIIPGPDLEPPSHPMWWNTNDPNYVKLYQ